MKELSFPRIMVVSGRGPYSFQRTTEGRKLDRSIGGVITALEPVMKMSSGMWISWGKAPGKVLIPPKKPRYVIKQIGLSQREAWELKYGFATKTLWPLAHSFTGKATFSRRGWKVFEKINRKFANAILEEVQPGDLIWVHDHHLALVPKIVRRWVSSARIAFFWHAPFPPPEVFQILPWRENILKGLLGSSLLGFQTESCMRNFLECVRRTLGLKVLENRRIVSKNGHETLTGVFPISIDFEFFDTRGHETSTARRAQSIRKKFGVEVLALAVDRMDYTKGIPERFVAVEQLIDKYRSLRGNFTLLQIAVPSRSKDEEYLILRKEVEDAAKRVNKHLGCRTWKPIELIQGSIPQTELIAHYLAADMAILTPLRDAMNLVAKEYVASRVDEDGVLVLSEFTGSAVELKEALIVNPYDIEDTVEKLNIGIRMRPKERTRRMKIMRERVRRHNVYTWVGHFLKEFQEVPAG
jgi:trehalose 6-phosphate synthase